MTDLGNYGSCTDFDGRLDDVVYCGDTDCCRFFHKSETDLAFFNNVDCLFYVDETFLKEFCMKTRMRFDDAKTLLRDVIGEKISMAGVSYEVAMQLLPEVKRLRRHGMSDDILCGVYRSEKLRIKITPTKEVFDEFVYNFNIEIVFVKDGRLLVI